MTYVYKVKAKYYKPNKKGIYPIERYLEKYQDENSENEIFAIHYILKPDTPIVRNLVKLFNGQDFQTYTHIDDPKARKQIEVDSGIKFEKKDGKWQVVEDEEFLRDLGTIQICVDFQDEETKALLFINSCDAVAYYSSEVLDQHIGDIVQILLQQGVIYKTKLKPLPPLPEEEPLDSTHYA